MGKIVNKAQQKKSRVNFISATFKNITGGLLEYTKEYLPGTTSVIEDSKEIFEDVKKTTQNTSGSVLSTFRSIAKLVSFKTLFNWYMDQGDQFGDTGGIGEDDLNFDIGGDSSSSSSDSLSDSTAKEVGSAEIKAVEKGTDKVAKTVLDTSQKMAELQVASLSHITNSLEKTNSIITSGFESVNNTLKDLIKVVSENTSSLIKLVSIGREEESSYSSKREFGMEDVLRGNFKFKDYFGYLKNKASNIGGMAEMALSMIGMIGSSPEMAMSMLQDQKKEWIKQGINWGIEKAFPGFSRMLKNLETKAGEWFSDALINLGKGRNPFTGKEMRGWWRSIGDFLGVTGGWRGIRGTQLDSFEQKRISFDTETKESITKVIPGYLREITKALTKKDLVYSYEKRSFMTTADYKKEYIRQVGQAVHLDIDTNSGHWTDKQKQDLQNNAIKQKVYLILDQMIVRAANGYSSFDELLDELNLSEADIKKGIFPKKMLTSLGITDKMLADDKEKVLRTQLEAVWNILNTLKHDSTQVKKFQQQSFRSASDIGEINKRFMLTSADQSLINQLIGNASKNGGVGAVKHYVNNELRDSQAFQKGLDIYALSLIRSLNDKNNSKYTRFMSDIGNYFVNYKEDFDKIFEGFNFKNADELVKTLTSGTAGSYSWDSGKRKIEQGDRKLLDAFKKMLGNIYGEGSIGSYYQNFERNVQQRFDNLNSEDQKLALGDITQRKAKGRAVTPKSGASTTVTYNNSSTTNIDAAALESFKDGITQFGEKFSTSLKPLENFDTKIDSIIKILDEEINKTNKTLSSTVITFSKDQATSNKALIEKISLLSKMKEDAEKSKTANLPAQSIKFDGIQDVRLVSDNIEELANKFLDKFKPIIDTTTVQVATPQGVISIPIPSEAIKASGANAGQKFATWLGETFNPVNNKLNQPVVIKQGSANIGNQIAEGAKSFVQGISDNVTPVIEQGRALLFGGEFKELKFDNEGKVIGTVTKTVDNQGLFGGLKNQVSGFISNIFPTADNGKIEQATQAVVSKMKQKRQPKSKDPKKRAQEEEEENQRISGLTVALGAVGGGLFGGPVGCLLGAMLGATAPISNIGLDIKHYLFGNLFDKDAKPGEVQDGLIGNEIKTLIIPFKLEIKKTLQFAWMRFKRDVLGPFQDFGAGIAAVWKKTGGKIFKSIADWYKTTPMWRWTSRIVKGFMNFFGSAAGKLWGALKNGVPGILGLFGRTYLGAMGKAVSASGGLINNILGSWSPTFAEGVKAEREKRDRKYLEDLMNLKNLNGLTISESFTEMLKGNGEFMKMYMSRPDLRDSAKMKAALQEENEKWVKTRAVLRNVFFGGWTSEKESPLVSAAKHLENIDKRLSGENNTNTSSVNFASLKSKYNKQDYISLINEALKAGVIDEKLAHTLKAQYFKNMRSAKESGTVFNNNPADNIADALNSGKLTPAQAQALKNQLNSGKSDDIVKANNDTVDSAIKIYNMRNKDDDNGFLGKVKKIFGNVLNGIGGFFDWVFNRGGLVQIAGAAVGLAWLIEQAQKAIKEGKASDLYNMIMGWGADAQRINSEATIKSIEQIMANKYLKKEGRLIELEKLGKEKIGKDIAEKAKSLKDVERLTNEFFQNTNLGKEEKRAIKKGIDEAIKLDPKLGPLQDYQLKMADNLEAESDKIPEQNEKINKLDEDIKQGELRRESYQNDINRLEKKQRKLKAKGGNLSSAELAKLNNTKKSLAELDTKLTNWNTEKANISKSISETRAKITENFMQITKAESIVPSSEGMSKEDIAKFNENYSKNEKAFMSKVAMSEHINIRLSGIIGYQVAVQALGLGIDVFINNTYGENSTTGKAIKKVLHGFILPVMTAGGVLITIINPKWIFGGIFGTIFDFVFSNVLKFTGISGLMSKWNDLANQVKGEKILKERAAAKQTTVEKEIENATKKFKKCFTESGGIIEKAANTAKKDLTSKIVKDLEKNIGKTIQKGPLAKLIQTLMRAPIAAGFEMAALPVFEVAGGLYGAADPWRVFEISAEITKTKSWKSLGLMGHIMINYMMRDIAAILGILANTSIGMLIEIAADILLMPLYNGINAIFKTLGWVNFDMTGLIGFQPKSIRGLLAWTCLLLFNWFDWMGIFKSSKEFNKELDAALKKIGLSRTEYVEQQHLSHKVSKGFNGEYDIFDKDGNLKNNLHIVRDDGIALYDEKGIPILYNTPTGKVNEEKAKSMGAIVTKNDDIELSNTDLGKDENKNKAKFTNRTTMANVNFGSKDLNKELIDIENRETLYSIREYIGKIIKERIDEIVYSDSNLNGILTSKDSIHQFPEHWKEEYLYASFKALSDYYKNNNNYGVDYIAAYYNYLKDAKGFRVSDLSNYNQGHISFIKTGKDGNSIKETFNLFDLLSLYNDKKEVGSLEELIEKLALIQIPAGPNDDIIDYPNQIKSRLIPNDQLQSIQKDPKYRDLLKKSYKFRKYVFNELRRPNSVNTSDNNVVDNSSKKLTSSLFNPLGIGIGGGEGTSIVNKKSGMDSSSTVAPASPVNSEYAYPVENWQNAIIRSKFNEYRYAGHYHGGIDIAFPGDKGGQKIISASDGILLYAGWQNPNNQQAGYGRMIVIKDPKTGNKFIYGHLEKINSEISKLPNGARIKKGAILGTMGTSGSSTGPHLHFEIRKGKPGTMDDYGNEGGNNGATTTAEITAKTRWDPEKFLEGRASEISIGNNIVTAESSNTDGQIQSKNNENPTSSFLDLFGFNIFNDVISSLVSGKLTGSLANPNNISNNNNNNISSESLNDIPSITIADNPNIPQETSKVKIDESKLPTAKNRILSKETMKLLYLRLRQTGFTHAAAIGVLANITAESEFSNKAYNTDSGAIGLAQWLDDRKDAFYKYAGGGIRDHRKVSSEKQIEFILAELGLNNKLPGNPRNIYSYNQFTLGKPGKMSLTDFMNLTDPSQATDIWTSQYERLSPVEENGLNGKVDRRRYAEELYKAISIMGNQGMMSPFSNSNDNFGLALANNLNFDKGGIKPFQGLFGGDQLNKTGQDILEQIKLIVQLLLQLVTETQTGNKNALMASKGNPQTIKEIEKLNARNANLFSNIGKMIGRQKPFNSPPPFQIRNLVMGM